jgi:AraC family transcriptional regulator of adaptative response/methylated-DNA-[protein]-cysteine methyltransferase
MHRDEIKYRDFQSPLGEMVAGATSMGVCFLEWHDRGGIELILERVAKRYKMSLVLGTNQHLGQLEKELSDYFEGGRKVFEVKIDVTGTPFELSVWKRLLKISYGETRSYGQIAGELGKPGASRAVGRANGANYLSIVIPCHRVIEANGNLRGYGGKLWRKKYLLELERGLKPEIAINPDSRSQTIMDFS